MKGTVSTAKRADTQKKSLSNAVNNAVENTEKTSKWTAFKNSKAVQTMKAGAGKFANFVATKAKDFGSDMSVAGSAFKQHYMERQAVKAVNNKVSKATKTLEGTGYVVISEDKLKEYVNKLETSLGMDSSSEEKQSEQVEQTAQTETTEESAQTKSEPQVQATQTEEVKAEEKHKEEVEAEVLSEDIELDDSEEAGVSEASDKQSAMDDIKHGLDDCASDGLSAVQAHFSEVFDDLRQQYSKMNEVMNSPKNTPQALYAALQASIETNEKIRALNEAAVAKAKAEGILSAESDSRETGFNFDVEPDIETESSLG
jgi:hypothetical protein